jgi:hypothetical protein
MANFKLLQNHEKSFCPFFVVEIICYVILIPVLYKTRITKTKQIRAK